MHNSSSTQLWNASLKRSDAAWKAVENRLWRGKKSALPMVLNWDRLQATYRAQKRGSFWLFRRCSHTLNKADSKRGFGLFSKTLWFLAKRQHIKGSIRKSPKNETRRPRLACRNAAKVLLASARFCSQKVRALSRIFPSALKKDLSHSLSCFSDHLCIMRCVCLYLPSRKTACDFEVFEEKRPLALWGLSFYEFAFASRTLKPKEGTAPPFIP